MRWWRCRRNRHRGRRAALHDQHGPARGRRTAEEARRREVEIEGEKRRTDAGRRANLDTKTTAVLAERDAFLAKGLDGFSPEEQVTRLDGLIARMQVLGRQGAGLPEAQTLWKAEQATRSRRDAIVREAAQKRARQPIPVAPPKPKTGPHTNFTILEMDAVRAAVNPLRADTFRADLARGVDLVARLGGFDRAGDDWVVRLVDGIGEAGRPGQGVLCRVRAEDTASLALLRNATPGLSAFRVIASDAEDVRFATNPVRLRIVLAPCRIAPPPDNSFLPGAPHPNDAKPFDLPSPTPHADLPPRAADEPPPVAASPPGLRCTTEVDRQRGFSAHVRCA